MINLAEHYNLDLFTFLVEALEKLLTKIKYYNHCTVHVRLLYIKLLTSSHNVRACMGYIANILKNIPCTVGGT
jgi:hypothetical protein